MSGKEIPGILKPPPVTMTALIDTVALPVEANSSDCVAGVFKGTSPKPTLDELTPSEITCTANCKANVSTTPPALAVSVAVCAELTKETAAVKLAVVDPACTVTKLGTVTAESLLDRLTPRPPLVAAEFRVTVQLSAPAPAINPLTQVMPVNIGRAVPVWPEAFNCNANVSATPPALAVRAAVCVVLTDATAAVKLAVVDPACTVTELGTVTAESLLAKLKLKPPLEAAAFSITVQPSLPAPVIDPIVHVRPLNSGTSVLPWPILEAFNCRKNVSATLPAPAVNVAVCTELTGETAAVKLAEVDPAATVTLAGKTTAALLLARLTAKPPLAAAALKVTAQLSLPAPVIDPIVHVRPLNSGTSVLPWPIPEAFNCKANVSTTPPALAISVAVCAELTEETAAVKLAVVDPACTVTEFGTVTAESLLDRLTAKPPLPAAEFNPTVQSSIADPVAPSKAQLSDVNSGLVDALASVPVPLSPTTKVPSAVASLAIFN
jgi:hypothetical protein